MSDAKDMLSFSGETALVTGAGQGLGRAYAAALAARGAHVVVNDIDERAHGAASEIRAAGGKATTAIGSVFEDAEAIVGQAVESAGRIDIVINNAGITGGGPFHEVPVDEWDRLIAIQLGGTVNISRAAWRHLAASGRGRLVNTSSSSVFGAPFTSQYAAAKGAIFALTRAWAGEGLTNGIRVNCIMPSAFTEMTAQIPDALFRKFLADNFHVGSVAEFVTWLVHRDTDLSGQTFQVGGNRAARVVLAEAAGITLPGAAAENWRGKEQELMLLGTAAYPLSMIDEVAWQARNLDAGARSDFVGLTGSSFWNGEG